MAFYVSYQSSRPQIAVDDLGPVHLVDHGREDILIGAFPVILSNRGGRTISLERLIRSSTPTALRIKDGVEFVDDPSLEVSYAIVDGISNSKAEFLNTYGDAEFLQLDYPQVHIRQVGPGASLPLTFFFIVRNVGGQALVSAKVAFSTDILFSDGTTHRMSLFFNPE